MKFRRKSLITFIAAAITAVSVSVSVSAERDGMNAGDPYGWTRSIEQGSSTGDHIGIFYKNNSNKEIIMFDILEWDGLNNIRQNSDTAWANYLDENGRFSNNELIRQWSIWYPDAGSGKVTVDSSRTTHETINGYDYFRYDRNGMIYLGGSLYGAYDTTTYLYAQNNCLYALYYNGWNQTTDNIADFFNWIQNISYNGSPSSTSDTIKIYVNGSQVFPDSDPVIINERTMVPIRVIAEALGYNVSWDGINQIVEVSNSRSSLRMMIGSTSLARYLYGSQGELTNNDIIYSDVAPMIMSERTYLPVRAVSEALGASVDWDENTRSVFISK